MTSSEPTPHETMSALIRELTALGDTSLPPRQRAQAAKAAAGREPVRISVPGLRPDQAAVLDEGLAAAHRAASRRTGAYLYVIETLLDLAADAAGTDRTGMLRRLTDDIDKQFGGSP